MSKHVLAALVDFFRMHPDDYKLPDPMMTQCYGEPGAADRKVGMSAVLGMGYGTGKPKPKMVHSYMGVNVDHMSREELIAAVIFLGEQCNAANASAAHYAKHMFDGFRRDKP